VNPLLNRLRSDLRFLTSHHLPALLAVAMVAFQVIFLLATAQGARAEVRKQFDVAVPGGTYGELARVALGGRDPIAETDAILAAMFGAMLALNVASATIIVLNTMLLLVAQRRPLIGRARALGATRAEISGQYVLLAGFACAATTLPAAALARLAAELLNASNVLHIFLDVSPELLALSFGLFGLAGMLGGYVPARKAALTDPWEVLQSGSELRRGPPQAAVVIASFWLAILLVGIGGGVREMVLDKAAEMPITSQAVLDTMYGKIDQAMSSFRVILLFLPLLSCVGVIASSMHLEAYARRREHAVARSLGETRRHLRRRIVHSAVRVAVACWVIGALLATLTARLMTVAGLPFPIDIPLWGLAMSLGASGLIGLAGGLGPGSDTARGDPAELLRGA
jgi:ABC-type antimicrobial peptide transport system permease subunit